MQSRRRSFEEKGVMVLNDAVSDKLVFCINNIVASWIKNYADELACSPEDYMKSVSRWAHPCKMTKQLYQWIESPLTNIASKFAGGSVRLHKINIISKSAYAASPVPCHQDIAYSREDPYEFSLWLALQDVSLSDGVLEFLPYSQTGIIEPAVDFWSPDFTDSRQRSPEWQKNSISVPVRTGDIIAFDSKIWHRSAPNTSGQNRFALVTRWSRTDYQLSVAIPEIRPLFFGMWTCAGITKSLLQQGLENYLQQPAAADLATILNLWQQFLISGKELPFITDSCQVQKALREVSVLNYAAAHHNGGDAQGTIYAHLWHTLLKPMVQWNNA